MDQKGRTVLHRNYKASAEAFLRAIKPYRKDIAVAVECMFVWYWLADVCAQEKITFVLGRVLYTKLNFYDQLLTDLELYILKRAKGPDVEAI